MSNKKVNYTEEQAATLSTAYTAASNDAERQAVVSEYVEKFGKKPQSIIAKLRSMKVYIVAEKPEKAPKVQSTPKDVLATNIFDKINSPMNRELFTDQLSKSGKQALQELAAHFGLEYIA